MTKTLSMSPKQSEVLRTGPAAVLWATDQTFPFSAPECGLTEAALENGSVCLCEMERPGGRTALEPRNMEATAQVTMQGRGPRMTDQGPGTGEDDWSGDT